MFKVNNKDTKTTPPFSSASIVNFEHVTAGWAMLFRMTIILSLR